MKTQLTKARNSTQALHSSLWIGLIGAWNPQILRTGSTLQDLSIAGKLPANGTPTNFGSTAPYGPGRVGIVTKFASASSNYISLGNPTKLALLSPFTISIWHLSSSFKNYSNLIFKGDSFGAEFGVIINSSGQWSGQIGTGGSFAGGLTAGKWQHVLYTYDGSNIVQYQDGLQVLATTASNSSRGSLVSLGADTVNNRYLDGQIGEVLFYNRVLTRSEITQLARGHSPFTKTDRSFPSKAFGVSVSCELATFSLTGLSAGMTLKQPAPFATITAQGLAPVLSVKQLVPYAILSSLGLTPSVSSILPLTAPNQGWANFLGIVRESTLAGSTTGTTYAVPGKVKFSFQPMLQGGGKRVNIWRQPSNESFSTIYWQGQLQLELGCTNTLLMLLETLFELQSQTNDDPVSGVNTYVFRMRRLAQQKSVKLWLEFNPTGPYYGLTGVVVESFQVTVRAPEIIGVNIQFKAVDIVGYSSSQAKAIATVESYTPLSKLAAQSTIKPTGFSDTVMDGLTEFNFMLADKVNATRFAENKKPTLWSPTGQQAVSGQVTEYFRNTMISDAVKSQDQVKFGFTIDAGNSRGLILSIPKSIIRAGTPPLTGNADTMNQASWEALASEDESSEPTLTLIV